MADRIAFAKIGWSDQYQGGPVIGRHGYLNTQRGHECFNFRAAPDGRYYGYIPPVGRGAPSPRYPNGWLLIFVAAYRGKGPLTAVGWYDDAAFADGYKPRPEYQLSGGFETDDTGGQFLYCVSADRAYLIPLQQRQDAIPGNNFRRSSILYVKGQPGQSEPWRAALARRAEGIVTKFGSLGQQVEEPAETSEGFPSVSAEHRRKVEEVAVRLVCRHLKEKGYTVHDRQKDRCGYDLLALHERNSMWK